jgi:hypothetical protein
MRITETVAVSAALNLSGAGLACSPLYPRVPPRWDLLGKVTEREPANLLALLAHAELGVAGYHGGIHDVPMRRAQESRMQVVAVQIDDRRREQCEIGDAGLFPMMGSLGAFGALISHQGDGGIFEKIASWIPALYGAAILGRLLAGDARISHPASLPS